MSITLNFGQSYLFDPTTEDDRYSIFPHNGLGPFTITRDALVNQIISRATPTSSVHISGCRGAGKTTLLNQIGIKLAAQKTVWHFENSDMFNDPDVLRDIKKAVKSKSELYVLVDETQCNHDATAFTILLKSPKKHNVTTIAAGIASSPSSSYQFSNRYQPEDLLLLTDDSLDEHGVTEFFTAGCEVIIKQQMVLLLKSVRSYVGGHVYPLMRLAELLKPYIVQGKSAEQVRKMLDSHEFRNSEDFQKMVDRIVPTTYTDLRPLLYRVRDFEAMEDLQKKGICNKNFELISPLLLEVLTSKTMPPGVASVFQGKLSSGLGGVSELLAYALPALNWNQYDKTGGPTEDALSLEVLVLLNTVPTLSHRLFNPKLVNAATARRRPDIFLNSKVNAYVECVLTPGTNDTAVRSLEEHIGRFLPKRGREPYYKIVEPDRTWAVLHYQTVGHVPMKLKFLGPKVEKGQPEQPMDPHIKAGMVSAFESGRIFTFLMQTHEVYCGDKLIASPKAQEGKDVDMSL